MGRRVSGWIGIVSIVVALMGLAAFNLLYIRQREQVMAERDAQLYSLVDTLDFGLVQQGREIYSELWDLQRQEGFRDVERRLLETGDSQEMREIIQESHLVTKRGMEGILLKNGTKTLLTVGDKVVGEYHIPGHYEDESIFICHDDGGRYTMAIWMNSPAGITYFFMLDLENFFQVFIPRTLWHSHWTVFYDQDSGLFLQNHENQDAYTIMTEEQALSREDGYSILVKNERAGMRGAETYEYANYEGRVVPERMVVVPSQDTLNGNVAIGIAMDSEELYSILKRSEVTLICITVLLILVGIVSAIAITQLSIYQQTKDREAALRQELAEANLKNSISQLQPHFMYNALSSIRELVLDKPAYAADMLYDFTIYLRACIRSLGSQDLIPFSTELQNVQAYVNIEKMRLGDRLQVNYEIQEDQFRMIPLGIQPLVENAIRHGIAPLRKHQGIVTLRSYRDGEDYVVEVQDNGAGFDYPEYLRQVESGERDSTGLKNSVLRIQQMLKGSVQVDSTPGVGTLVKVRIPAEQNDHSET